ncbi:20014_t:CDS:1 [Dentiscutata erythropus]|uniref:20014_t:CDS:1 n=1 Tax=Dentiscutata erythropus TaxID=1348616 RepID=A0A9N9B802_9GLOM|nr:20014_t:CDS:1 [Dentiscutata erythropus]
MAEFDEFDEYELPSLYQETHGNRQYPYESDPDELYVYESYSNKSYQDESYPDDLYQDESYPSKSSQEELDKGKSSQGKSCPDESLLQTEPVECDETPANTK